MKILQINSVCGTGSTGKIAVDNYKKHLAEGHESWIAYGRGEGKNCNHTIKIGKDLDIKLHGIYTRIFDKHGFASKKATLEFIRKIEKINPDVIHLHNIHGYYINIEILFDYLKKANKKVIWTLHDCWSFTGHCAYFDFVGCDKWKIECYQCPQKNTYPASNFLENSKWNYKKKKELFTGLSNLKIITPSKWLADLVKESFLKEYLVEVRYNEIDKEIFRPRESDFRKKCEIEDKFIILGVASPWSKRKGFEDFIELSKIISEKEVIIMVGLNKKQIKKLPKNIIGIEKTNNQIELAEIYSTSDLFFNPTYEDNYPTTNLEAIACGTYVVTYNSGGSAECITGNINGNINGNIIEKKDFKNYGKILKILRNNNKETDLFSKDVFV